MQLPGYTKAAAVTTSDSAALDPGFTTKALFIGGAGNVSLVVNGSTVAFNGCFAGQVLPVAAQKVRATGTTATNIVALGD